MKSARRASPRLWSLPRTMMRPLVKLTSSRTCFWMSQPACCMAGAMNLVQISRSERDFLSMVGDVPMAYWKLYQTSIGACCHYGCNGCSRGASVVSAKVTTPEGGRPAWLVGRGNGGRFLRIDLWLARAKGMRLAARCSEAADERRL